MNHNIKNNISKVGNNTTARHKNIITETFNIIEWEEVEWKIEIFPDLYQMCSTKQATGCCETGKMIKNGASRTHRSANYAGVYACGKI